MFNTNEWFIFGSGSIDKKTCNKIKNWAKDKWLPSTVDVNDKTTEEERRTGKVIDYQRDSKQRVSDVAWCNEQWLYDIIFPFMNAANEEAGWGYEIKSAESCQLTRYKKGGFYEFHHDGFSDQLSAYNSPHNIIYHTQLL